jgi:hypothetical protein
MPNLKEQGICVALLQTRKTCLGNYVRPGQLSVTMPLEENRRVSGFLHPSVSGFLHPNVGKTVRIRSFISSLTGSTDGNMQKGKKSSTTADEIPFRIWLADYACCMEHANEF